MKRSKFPEEQIAYALRQTESGTRSAASAGSEGSVLLTL